MERLLTYNDGEYTINVGDLFNVDGVMVDVKELFILNEITYVSYTIRTVDSLEIETVNKFINDKSEYFDTVISHTPNEYGCCTCGEEH